MLRIRSEDHGLCTGDFLHTPKLPDMQLFLYTHATHDLTNGICEEGDDWWTIQHSTTLAGSRTTARVRAWHAQMLIIIMIHDAYTTCDHAYWYMTPMRLYEEYHIEHVSCNPAKRPYIAYVQCMARVHFSRNKGLDRANHAYFTFIRQGAAAQSGRL